MVSGSDLAFKDFSTALVCMSFHSGIYPNLATKIDHHKLSKVETLLTHHVGIFLY